MARVEKRNIGMDKHIGTANKRKIALDSINQGCGNCRQAAVPRFRYPWPIRTAGLPENSLHTIDNRPTCRLLTLRAWQGIGIVHAGSLPVYDTDGARRLTHLYSVGIRSLRWSAQGVYGARCKCFTRLGVRVLFCSE
jgi:hypothetical protein